MVADAVETKALDDLMATVFAEEILEETEVRCRDASDCAEEMSAESKDSAALPCNHEEGVSDSTSKISKRRILEAALGSARSTHGYSIGTL